MKQYSVFRYLLNNYLQLGRIVSLICIVFLVITNRSFIILIGSNIYLYGDGSDLSLFIYVFYDVLYITLLLIFRQYISNIQLPKVRLYIDCLIVLMILLNIGYILSEYININQYIINDIINVLLIICSIVYVLIGCELIALKGESQNVLKMLGYIFIISTLFRLFSLVINNCFFIYYRNDLELITLTPLYNNTWIALNTVSSSFLILRLFCLYRVFSNTNDVLQTGAACNKINIFNPIKTMGYLFLSIPCLFLLSAFVVIVFYIEDLEFEYPIIAIVNTLPYFLLAICIYKLFTKIKS